MFDANRQAKHQGCFKGLPAVWCWGDLIGVVNRVRNKLIHRQEWAAKLEPELVDAECIHQSSVPSSCDQAMTVGQAVESMAAQIGATAA
jgi:hypothetical protein